MSRLRFFDDHPYVILAIVTFITHCPSFFNINLFPIDDAILVTPLEGLTSIFDYVKLEVFDIQPLRDLSYWLDIKIGNLFINRPIYHQTSVFIFGLAVFNFYYLSSFFLKDNKIRLFLSITFIVHPMIVPSVAWISARKHLLSFLFTLMATNLYFYSSAKKKRVWTLAILPPHLFALLSHSINGLWPLWAFYQSFKTNLRRWLPCLSLAIILSAIIIYLKVGYYNSSSVFIDRPSILPNLYSILNMPVAIGRYLFNFFIPLRLLLYYSPGSIFNLIGLIFIPLIVIVLIRQRKDKRIIALAIFSSLPLFIATGLDLTSFVQDTYFITSAAGLILMGGILLEKMAINWLTDHKGIFSFLMLMLFCISFHRSLKWRDPESLLENNFHKERGHSIVYFYAKELLNKKRPLDAIPAMTWLHAFHPTKIGKEIWSLFASQIYYSPEIPLLMKQQILENYPQRIETGFMRYYLASVYARKNNYGKAYQTIAPLILRLDLLKEDNSILLAEAEYMCLKSELKNCSPQIEALKQLIKENGSSLRFYLDRKNELEKL